MSEHSMNKRQLQKQQTREHLLQVALVVFAEKGLLMTRTVDVANAAGVSHGSVFAHFPKREDLVVAVIEAFGRKVGVRTRELMDKGASLKHVLEAHLKVISEFEGFYRRLVIEAPLLPDEARATMTAFNSAVSHHLSTVAEKAATKKKIRRIPTHLLFNTWLGLVNHYLVNADLFAPSGSVIKKCGKELVEHYILLLKG